jgi:TolB-like protein
MGDGVNIAARLEGIGEPNSICLSDAAYEQVRDKVNAEFVDLGDRELKNIARPVRAYRVTLNQNATKSGSVASAVSSGNLALPDKPSIAVLAFQNMSGDPEQEYFADGLAEDIITRLSRLRWLFVSARNSSFTYKGKAVDAKQVRRELGVRYVLDGSVRRSGHRLRISAQVSDSSTGLQVWAERYDVELADFFALQDQIAESVNAFAHSILGATYGYGGMPDDGLHHLALASRLSPRDYTYAANFSIVGLCHFMAKRFVDAVANANAGRWNSVPISGRPGERWRRPRGWPVNWIRQFTRCRRPSDFSHPYPLIGSTSFIRSFTRRTGPSTLRACGSQGSNSCVILATLK